MTPLPSNFDETSGPIGILPDNLRPAAQAALDQVSAVADYRNLMMGAALTLCEWAICITWIEWNQPNAPTWPDILANATKAALDRFVVSHFDAEGDTSVEAVLAFNIQMANHTTSDAEPASGGGFHAMCFDLLTDIIARIPKAGN